MPIDFSDNLLTINVDESIGLTLLAFFATQDIKEIAAIDIKADSGKIPANLLEQTINLLKSVIQGPSLQSLAIDVPINTHHLNLLNTILAETQSGFLSDFFCILPQPYISSLPMIIALANHCGLMHMNAPGLHDLDLQHTNFIALIKPRRAREIKFFAPTLSLFMQRQLPTKPIFHDGTVSPPGSPF